MAAISFAPSPAAAAKPADGWAGEIAEASARFGVPGSWIRRVMALESGGRLYRRGVPVVSRAGAMGLMQLMPGTWQAMRQRLGLGSDPFEPRDNILAGAAYLRLMYERFGYPGLFAAYNAGPSRYSAALAGKRRLPSETTVYVDAVTSALRAAASVRQEPPTTFAIRPQDALFAARAERPDSDPRSAIFVALAGSRSRHASP